MVTTDEPKPYCICPLGLRIMVDCRGMKCSKCLKPITDETYSHWAEKDA